MRVSISLAAATLLVVFAAAPGDAQLAPGDIIVTGVDTAKAGGLTLRLDPATGAVTTLIPKLSTPRNLWSGNWVEMGPNNRDVWVAYEDGAQKGAMFVLDPAGKVATIRPLPWRADCFRFRDNGGLTWSGLGGYLTDRLVLTDAKFLNWWAFASNLPPISLSHQEIEEDGLLAVSFQAVSPKGGILVLDPRTRTVVRSLTGLGMVNTVDYDPASGMIHAVEFGSPKNPTAFSGSLLEVDTVAGRATSLIDASGAGGVAVDRLNWVLRRLDNTLLLGARHRVFVFDLGARKIVKTWAVAADRTFAITGGTVYGSRRLRLDISKGTRPGNTVDIHVGFRHAQAPGSTYRLACANGQRPGIWFGALQLDLRLDTVFAVSVLDWYPGIFRKFRGVLDASGNATAQMAIPDVPGLYEIRFLFGGIAFIKGGIHVTNVEGFTVTR